ncbi:hypothetical protein PUN28_012979 [Cardiocondyla obscurior]|uniref:Secreted protein n=1 Tax=Cardiocondyla obscurior TaxID=286306 RepID=A0AAW2F9C6_9HYME
MLADITGILLTFGVLVFACLIWLARGTTTTTAATRPTPSRTRPMVKKLTLNCYSEFKRNLLFSSLTSLGGMNGGRAVSVLVAAARWRRHAAARPLSRRCRARRAVPSGYLSISARVWARVRSRARDLVGFAVTPRPLSLNALHNSRNRRGIVTWRRLYAARRRLLALSLITRHRHDAGQR